MKERFSNGFISGLVGGIVPLAINFGSRALNFNYRQYPWLVWEGNKLNNDVKLDAATAAG